MLYFISIDTFIHYDYDFNDFKIRLKSRPFNVVLRTWSILVYPDLTKNKTLDGAAAARNRSRSLFRPFSVDA